MLAHRQSATAIDSAAYCTAREKYNIVSRPMVSQTALCAHTGRERP